MEKRNVFGNNTLLIVAALLALFFINIVISPPSVRDFATVLAAMAAVGCVLFLWSRRNPCDKEAGKHCNHSSDTTPPGSALHHDHVATPADNLTALLRSACQVDGASFAAILVIDRESGNLQSMVSSIVRTDDGLRFADHAFRLCRADAPELFEAMNSTPPAIVHSQALKSLVTDPAVNHAQMWAVPMVCLNNPQGVLMVSKTGEDFTKSSLVGLKTIAASAAAIIAAECGQTLFMDELARIARVSHTCSRVGPQAPADEVKRAIVDSVGPESGTDLVALYTIDPCLGGIDCEATDGVSAELQAAFLNLFGNVVTERNQCDILVQIENPGLETDNEQALRVFVDSGIKSVIACPVRSELGVSGALVAFYSSDVWFSRERRGSMQIIAGLVAATLSHAVTMEESGHLLDDLAGANQELSLQATIDGLTGLANHRTLQQTLTEMCKSSRSHKTRVFSVLMVDVDHFKIYNDTHGHREGDAALRGIAKLLSSELRQGDLAARYGGEEFALILKSVGKDTALGIAERIRRRAADHQLHKGSLTISLGLAEFPADGNTPAELIERADRALYHAKVTGRNRVVVWGTAGCLPASSNIVEDSKGPKRNILVLTSTTEPTGDVITQTLEAEDYAVHRYSSSDEVAAVLRTQSFDLAMVSLESLPNGDINSLGLLASVHPNLPVVLITAKPPLEFSREALRQGASDILSIPFVPAELPLVVERNIERRRLERQRLTEKSTSIMLQAIEALVAAIDAKDHFTAGHSQRVTSLALAISDDLSLSSDDRYALELAAKIHDIGKIALPDSALNKQSPLNEEEWHAMREHPTIGCKIVGTIDELAYVSAIIRHHHEWLDGTGYPDGLHGNAIPYLAQIIAVADAYEAITSQRAHRNRLTPSEAIEELRSGAGTHYAPEIVEILDRKLRESGEINDQQTEAA